MGEKQPSGFTLDCNIDLSRAATDTHEACVICFSEPERDAPKMLLPRGQVSENRFIRVFATVGPPVPRPRRNVLKTRVVDRRQIDGPECLAHAGSLRSNDRLIGWLPKSGSRSGPVAPFVRVARDEDGGQIGLPLDQLVEPKVPPTERLGGLFIQVNAYRVAPTARADKTI